MEQDLLLAIRLQEQFDREAQDHREAPPDHQEAPDKRRLESQGPLSIVDESWEVLDPNPDARALFLDFNQRFFWGKLSGVEVKWSPRMTLCAGVCSYEGHGGLCSIRLSEPLLKLRPRKDLVETLLHEMIHALLFVTQNNRDRDGHGPEFRKHMNRINQASGTRITVYHSFHDEVDVYRQHWWRCDGPCRTRGPYYGWVKRAMNRAPSPLDPWWEDHRRTCGGSYSKVKEPEGYGKKGNKRGNKEKEGNKEGNMAKKKLEATGSKSLTTGSASMDIRNVIPFSGRGFLLRGTSSSFRTPTSILDPSPQPSSSSSEVRPPRRTSVSNIRAFVNINGSPVRIPKPPRSSTPADPSRQKSIQELFGGSSFRSPTIQPNTHRESTVSRSVGSTQGMSKWSPYRPPSSPLAAGPSKQTNIQELFHRSSSKNPTSRPDANAATVVTEARVRPVSSPQVQFSTDEPHSSSSGPAQSRFFTDPHSEAAVGVPAGGPASRKRLRDEANVSDFKTPVASSLMVSCPVCQVKVQESKINEHLDSCLS